MGKSELGEEAKNANLASLGEGEPIRRSNFVGFGKSTGRSGSCPEHSGGR
jgi:hypothetical protein